MGALQTSCESVKKYENGTVVNARVAYRINELLNGTTSGCERKYAHEEYRYLELVARVLKYGRVREDRTGTGTLGLFGWQLRFSLHNNTLPLLTTKRVFWRGIVAELLWMLSGSTDSRKLAKQGVHIWDENSSRRFLNKNGLTENQEGDLGPIYGFQWRHFGAEYEGAGATYRGKGVDQLRYIVETIKRNPTSRRMVMTAWNPVDLPKMAVPPCHCLAQFYVQDGQLSCQVYQRSADIGLGLPFNIASYSLLTIMLANVCGLEAGELVHVLGDAHIYLNHVNQLSQQLMRSPMPFPKLRIRRSVKRVENFTADDFELVGYKHHPFIDMPMAV